MFTFGYIYITKSGCIILRYVLELFWVIDMNCENEFCVYQDSGICTLESIELDIMGQCKECIYVELDKEFLKIQKQKTINKLG